MQHKLNDKIKSEMSKGNKEITKSAHATVQITRDMTNDCKHLLALMGVPYFDSPSEAEA
jgi:flap endonuclease-1